MTDRAHIVSRTLETKIAIAENNDINVLLVSLDALKEIITLLNEQEAVEPSFKQDKDGIFVWCCGSCGAYMYHIYDGIDKAKEYAKFCRQCGKPVLWEGR